MSRRRGRGSPPRWWSRPLVSPRRPARRTSNRATVSYVNIPNNYWTESPTVNDSVTVVGQTIPLVWTPTGTTWNFGDGASATGDGVQGADVGAPGAIEHSYARQGSYDISTTTTYNLSFVLPGQGTADPFADCPSQPAHHLARAGDPDRRRHHPLRRETDRFPGPAGGECIICPFSTSSHRRRYLAHECCLDRRDPCRCVGCSHRARGRDRSAGVRRKARHGDARRGQRRRAFSAPTRRPR